MSARSTYHRAYREANAKRLDAHKRTAADRERAGKLADALEPPSRPRRRRPNLVCKGCGTALRAPSPDDLCGFCQIEIGTAA